MGDIDIVLTRLVPSLYDEHAPEWPAPVSLGPGTRPALCYSREGFTLAMASGEFIVPPGVSYTFAGSYENQVRSQKTLSVVLPLALFGHLAQLWVTTEMYRTLLSSSAAEHSARFQLMEGAAQNSGRLIDERYSIFHRSGIRHRRGP